jgi:hypothetical protein
MADHAAIAHLMRTTKRQPTKHSTSRDAVSPSTARPSEPRLVPDAAQPLGLFGPRAEHPSRTPEF